MFNLSRNIFLALFFSLSVLNADTMFMLTKMDKVYPVVENYSSKLPMSIKDGIYDELRYLTDELKIDTGGYSHRTLGFIIYETVIDSKAVLNVDLVLGEQIKRIDDDEEVYALTYEKRRQFFLDGLAEEQIVEKTMDSVDLLINSFMEQYKEDNE